MLVSFVGDEVISSSCGYFLVPVSHHLVGGSATPIMSQTLLIYFEVLRFSSIGPRCPPYYSHILP